MKKKMEELAEEYCKFFKEERMKRCIAHQTGFTQCHALLESREKVLVDALNKIVNARRDNPNQEMGDLLLYKSEVARQALAALESKQVDENESGDK